MKWGLLLLLFASPACADQAVKEDGRWLYSQGSGMSHVLAVYNFKVSARCSECKARGVRQVIEEKTKRVVRYCPNGHWWIMPKSVMSYKED